MNKIVIIFADSSNKIYNVGSGYSSYPIFEFGKCYKLYFNGKINKFKSCKVGHPTGEVRDFYERKVFLIQNELMN